MCVTFTGKWRRAERTIIAYKIAKLRNDGVAESFVSPSNREAQSAKHRCIDSTGDIVQYPIGETIKCKTYGFYLYREVPDDGNDYRYPRCVLKVRIEKGSMYRLGRRGSMGHKTINARKITALSRMRYPE